MSELPPSLATFDFFQGYWPSGEPYPDTLTTGLSSKFEFVHVGSPEGLAVAFVVGECNDPENPPLVRIQDGQRAY